MSVDGRFACDPGMLVVHPPYHAHANRFCDDGARVLNIMLPGRLCDIDRYRIVKPPDPNAFERLVRLDSRAAAGAVVEELGGVLPNPPLPWLSRMARRLRQLHGENAGIQVCRLARMVGVTPAYATRAFKDHYGIGPSAYRREFRLRLAQLLLRCGRSPAEAGSVAGFADQSHFGRELKRATGLTPRGWRTRAAQSPLPADIKSVLDSFPY